MNKTRQQLIDELPDELLVEAKRNLQSLEWFIALPTNAAEDEAVFDEAFQLQAQRQTDAALGPIRCRRR